MYIQNIVIVVTKPPDFLAEIDDIENKKQKNIGGIPYGRGLIECDACGYTVANNAFSCPKCGNSITVQTLIPVLKWSLIISFILAIIFTIIIIFTIESS